jgi:anionic cell wall polymer biosynthesis LytR-Cps2A-Psr (LCP) family protein
MNNTRTLAIVAVLTAATLVVGLTVAATMTTSAFAGGSKRYGHDKYMKGGQDSYKKDGHDKYMKGKGQDSYKKDGNGNTNTAQILKQNAKASKFSIVEQNGENSICTHPSTTSPSGSCTSQSNQPFEVP